MEGGGWTSRCSATSVDACGWCSPEHACAVLSFVFNVDSAAEDTHKTKLGLTGEQWKGSLPQPGSHTWLPFPRISTPTRSLQDAFLHRERHGHSRTHVAVLSKLGSACYIAPLGASNSSSSEFIVNPCGDSPESPCFTVNPLLLYIKGTSSSKLLERIS